LADPLPNPPAAVIRTPTHVEKILRHVGERREAAEIPTIPLWILSSDRVWSFFAIS